MAVYTEVGSEALAAFLEPYALGRLTAAKGIAEGVENSNYMIETTQGRFILTLYEKRVRPEDLPFFIALMRHLAAAGLACPQPVAARDGAVLRRLAGRPAALFTFLAGLSPQQVQDWHCAALGSALARLHRAAEGFPESRPNRLSVAGWQPLIEDCRAGADAVSQNLSEELDEAYQTISAAWPRTLPSGIVHADLFPDNVFFLGKQLSGLIDFYFACTDFYAYDLAVCLNAWCFDGTHSYVPERGAALIQAYIRERRLTAAELQALPALAAGAALRFLLTRLYDWLNRPPGAMVRPKDPREYLTRLRFHRIARGPEAYGFAGC
ncbi:MAG: homoserine kinase [Rhodospirillales bacterium]|nr:homoserine kinase [Rhodospirillales bacterium]